MKNALQSLILLSVFIFSVWCIAVHLVTSSLNLLISSKYCLTFVLAEYLHNLHYLFYFCSCWKCWVNFSQFIDKRKYEERTDFRKPLKGLLNHQDNCNSHSNIMFCGKIHTIGFIWMLFFSDKGVSFLVIILLFLLRLDNRDLHVKILKCLFGNSWKVLLILSKKYSGFFITISQSLNTSGIFSTGYFSAERKKCNIF